MLATLTAFALSTVRSVEASEPVSFFDDFIGPDGIITNLFGSANPDIEGAHVSDKWQATSGTLYRQNNEGWSGVPDRIPPGFNSTIDSIPYNDSAIFRVVNKGPLFDEVTVNVRLKPIRFLTAQETDPINAWDGLHIMLRWQDQTEFYAVSVNRRDQVALIERKNTGGPSNGGTYTGLQSTSFPYTLGEWQDVRASIQTLPNNTVQISLVVDGTEILNVIDTNPILAPGRVGIRGDNLEFTLDDFDAQGTGIPNPPPPVTAGPPVPLSATPSFATIETETPFALAGTFGDGDGWNDIRLAEFRVSDTYSSAPRCLIRYDENNDEIKLFTGSGWLNAGSPGSGTLVSTADCSLDAAASSAVGSGAALTVTLQITLHAPLLGPRNIWLRAFGDEGLWGGPGVDFGDLTVEDGAAPPPPPSTPTSVTITPDNPTVAPGDPIALTGTFADANGWTDLRLAEFRVATTFFTTPRCLVRYDQDLDLFKLYNGGPWLIAGSPGSGTTVATADCALDAAASSVSVVDANTLAVTIAVTFTTTLEGSRNLWLRAFDDAGTWGTQDDRGDALITSSGETSLATVVDGYTDQLAYNPNSQQQVFVNASNPQGSAEIELYDVLGNVVDTVTFTAQTQTPQNPEPWTNGFGYAASFTYDIGPLPSGVYLWANTIPFVVRDASSTSAIRVVMPTNTINAYNCAGGRNTYDCGGTTDVPDLVSFRRPMPVSSLPTAGGPVIPLDDDGLSIPFFWWLEQQTANLGADYGALVDSDLDDPASLVGAQLLVIPGHSEYWSRAARLNVDAFVDAGGHLAILSGNTMWWQVRYQGDQMVIYKSTDDPIADPLLETINWPSPLLAYPVVPSIGAEFQRGGYADANPPDPAPASMFGYKIVAPDSPLLEGTNLAAGDVLALYPGSSEYDGAPLAGVDANGFPIIDELTLGFEQIELIGFDYGFRAVPTVATMIALQRTASSGHIVNAATMHWSFNMVTSASSATLQTITFNILDKLLHDQPIFTPETTLAVAGVSPTDGETNVDVGSSVTVNFVEAVDPASVTASTFTLSDGTPVGGSVSVAPDGLSATFAPDAVLADETTYTIAITADVLDSAGVPIIAPFTSTFRTVDGTAPTVADVSPADTAIDVAVDATVTVTFSEEVDAATVTSATFTLTDGGAVTGTVTVASDGLSAGFTPSADLADVIVYTVTVTSGVTDLTGNPFDAPFTSTFTTADTTPPTVSGVSPTDSATEVALDTGLSVTFSEAIDPTTVTASTFTLSDGTPVGGSVSVAPDGLSAAFAPVAALDSETTYTVTVTTAVADPTGNALEAPFTSTFRTVDGTAPTVADVSPADTAIDVAVDATVTVTFSEEVDAATVTSATFTLDDGGVVTGTITVASDGFSATLAPSADLADVTVYSVTVTSGVTDLTGNPFDAPFTSTFTTADTTPPTVSGVSPTDSATEVALDTGVSVTFSEAIDPTTVTASTFTLSDGTPVGGSVSVAPDGLSAAFTPTGDLADGVVHTITVTTAVADPTGNALEAPFTSTFRTVDGTAPTVADVSPVDTAIDVAVDATVTVTFSEEVDAATVTSATFTLDDGGVVTGTITVASDGFSATLAPSADLADVTVYSVTVTSGVTDLTGNPFDAPFTSTFTTADTTPPTVSGVSPTDGATEVALDAGVSVTFSEAIDPASVTASTFTLSDGTPVGGSVSVAPDGLSAAFTPTGDLADGVVHTITVTTAVADPTGNALAALFTSSFTTVDITSPAVTGVSPADTAIDVAVDATVTVTFSEEVDAATVTSATFTLDGGAVTGTITVAPNGLSAGFTPSTDLADVTVYTVTVTNGVTDLTGNALAALFTSTFTTADTTPPTVSGVSPTDGATEVALDIGVSVTFSEAIDPTTVTATSFTVSNGSHVSGAIVVAPNGLSATFTPDADLSDGATYTITLTTAVTDVAGNGLAPPSASTFTTVDLLEIYVDSIDIAAKQKGPRWDVKATLTLIDEFGNAVSGAQVSIVWTLPDGSTLSENLTTNGKGQTVVDTGRIPAVSADLFTLSVVNVSKSGAFFNTAASVTVASFVVP